MIKAARRCPKCGGDSRVYGTREIQSGQIRRNRKCVSCGFSFITLETYKSESSKKDDRAEHAHWIVKRGSNGRIVNFYCSSCGPGNIHFVMDKYCPYCGADMDGPVEYV